MTSAGAWDTPAVVEACDAGALRCSREVQASLNSRTRLLPGTIRISGGPIALSKLGRFRCSNDERGHIGSKRRRRLRAVQQLDQ